MRKLTVLITAICLSLFSLQSGLAGELSPREAVQYVGEQSTVVGTVAQVSRSRGGTTFINFGGRYPNHIFYAVIFKNKAGRFPNVGELQGRQVAISGVIELYKGKPQIILVSPRQIELR